MWKSKRTYKWKNAVGYVVFIERSGQYILEDKRGIIRPIDQIVAKQIHDIEENIPSQGRPAIWPGCDVEDNSITLPKAYWAKLQKPYSRAIGELICPTQRP